MRALNSLTLTVGVLGAVACGTSSTFTTDSAATADVTAQVTKTMAAFAAMDLPAFKAGMAGDVTAFEIDLEGNAVRLGSLDAVGQFAEETFAALKKMNATLTLDVHATSCHAASTLGYCTVEFEVKVSVPNNAPLSQATRNTIVLRKAEEGWKWSHWHSSAATATAPGAGAD